MLFVAVNVESSKPRFKVEVLMVIATEHEREELEAQLQGKNILEINHPVGPFGTKEAPAFVTSVHDERIVGCPGGEGALPIFSSYDFCSYIPPFSSCSLAKFNTLSCFYLP